MKVDYGGIVVSFSAAEYATLQRLRKQRDGKLRPATHPYSNVAYVPNRFPFTFRVDHADPFFWSKWIKENLMKSRKHTVAASLDLDAERKKVARGRLSEAPDVPLVFNEALWRERW